MRDWELDKRRYPAKKTGMGEDKDGQARQNSRQSLEVWQVRESTITSTSTSKSKISSFSSGYAGISCLLSFWGSWREAAGALNRGGGAAVDQPPSCLLPSLLPSGRDLVAVTAWSWWCHRTSILTRAVKCDHDGCRYRMATGPEANGRSASGEGQPWLKDGHTSRRRLEERGGAHHQGASR